MYLNQKVMLKATPKSKAHRRLAEAGCTSKMPQPKRALTHEHPWLRWKAWLLQASHIMRNGGWACVAILSQIFYFLLGFIGVLFKQCINNSVWCICQMYCCHINESTNFPYILAHRTQTPTCQNIFQCKHDFMPICSALLN